jgi:hypothetical protein
VISVHDLEFGFSSVAVRSVGELVGESRLYSFRAAGDKLEIVLTAGCAFI